MRSTTCEYVCCCTTKQNHLPTLWCHSLYSHTSWFERYTIAQRLRLFFYSKYFVMYWGPAMYLVLYGQQNWFYFWHHIHRIIFNWRSLGAYVATQCQLYYDSLCYNQFNDLNNKIWWSLYCVNYKRLVLD